MSDSYKIYASKDYVDSKSLPEGGGSNQQLVTDAEGNVKWEERYGYMSPPVETEVFPEQTIAFEVSGEVGQAISPVAVELIEGNTYTVMYDGVRYELIAKLLNGVYSYIGNPLIWGLEDTGEPFIYASVGNETMWLSYNTDTEHVISMTSAVSTPVPYLSKYIPWNEAPDNCYIVRSSPKYLTAEQKEEMYTAWQAGKMVFAYGSSANDQYPVIGMFYSEIVGLNYTIITSTGSIETWLGTEWRSLELTQSNIENIVNRYLEAQRSYKLYSASGNDIEIGEWMNAYLQWNETTGRPKVYGSTKSSSGSVLQNFDLVCQGDNGIIVSSSTEDSAKQFNITVDDSGIPTIADVDDSTNVWTPNYVTTPIVATVGQTIVVKAVDENGKPTEWEAVDMASGSGVTTWDDLGLGEATETVIVDNVSVDLSTDYGEYFCGATDVTVDPFVATNSYIVILDGTEYEAQYDTGLMIPDLPFLISAGGILGTGKLECIGTEAGVHTLSIRCIQREILPVPSTYLPTIPAEKLPTIPAEKLPTIKKTRIDILPGNTCEYSFAEVRALVEAENAIFNFVSKGSDNLIQASQCINKNIDGVPQDVIVVDCILLADDLTFTAIKLIWGKTSGIAVTEQNYTPSST